MGIGLSNLGAINTNGDWGDGGIVSKALDVLATPQYAVAGGLHALTKGEDPFAGAVTGVQHRASNVDTVQELGLKGLPAKVLGIGADIALDPINYIPFASLVGMGAKTGRLARIGVEGMRAADEILTTVKAGEDVSMPLLHASRKFMARETYNKILGGVAKEDASPELLRAAYEGARSSVRSIGGITSPQNHEELLKVLGKALNDPSLIPDISPGLRKDVGGLLGWAVKTTGDTLRDTKAFGAFGPVFANQLDSAVAKAQRLAASRLSYFNETYAPVLRKFSKAQREAWSNAADGAYPLEKLPQELQDLLARYKRDARQVFDELTAKGVREFDHMRTATLNSMKLTDGDRGLLPRLLKAGVLPGDTNPLLDQLSPRGLEFFKDIARPELGAKIVGGGDDAFGVTLSLQRTEHYAMRSLSPAGKKQMRLWSQMADADLQASLRKSTEFGYVQPEQIRKMIELLGDGGQYFRPGDISETFQVRRMAHVKLPDWMWQHDPDIWLKKWFEHSANRVAHADVFGGTNEYWDEVRTGITSHSADAGKAAEQIWNHYTGRPSRADAAGAVSLMNKLSSVMFLGPRTALLQLTQIANPTASFGFKNTQAAMASYFKDLLGDGRLGRMVERSGALAVSTEKALEGGAVADKALNFWHRAMGIRTADAGVRAISAIAASYKAQELAEAAAKQAFQHGRVHPKVVEELRQLGLDVAEVVTRRGELTDDHLMSAMMNGANLTQFATRTQDLPRMFHGTGGRFFLKFKSFAFQQANFIHKEITSKLANRDTFAEGAKRAMQYGAMFGWTYSQVAKHLAAMQNKDVQSDDDVAYMQNMLLTGALGIWGDTAVGVLKGNEALGLGLIAGPNVALLSRLAAAPVASMREGSLDPFKQVVPAIVRQPAGYAQHLMEDQ